MKSKNLKTEYRIFTCASCHRFIEIDTHGPNEPTEEHKEPICRNVEWDRCNSFHILKENSGLAKLNFRIYR